MVDDNKMAPVEIHKDALGWIFGMALILLWGAVFFAFSTPESSNSKGLQHSQYQAMDQGGDGAARHKDLLVTGWVFGSVQIAFFVSLLAWGMLRRTEFSTTADDQNREKKRLVGLFLIGGLLFEGVFGLMCLAYRNSLIHSEVAFLGPFPSGVSWLLFGVWLIPAYFIVLYISVFDRQVAPPQTMQQFEELVSERAEV